MITPINYEEQPSELTLLASHTIQTTVVNKSSQSTALKEAVTNDLQVEHPSFLLRSKGSWSKIVQAYPLLADKINEFKTAHAGNITTIQSKSWNELKAQRGVDMTRAQGNEGLSMEEFRSMANQFINDMVVEVAENLGL